MAGELASGRVCRACLVRVVVGSDFLAHSLRRRIAVWLFAVVWPGCPAGDLQSLIQEMLHDVVVVVVCYGGPAQSVSG